MLIPADPMQTSETVLAISKVLNFVTGFMLYVFLFMSYGEFYFIIDRSLSLRVMVELERHPEKRVSFEELKNVYSPDEIYRRRFRHMVESGCIVEEAGYYRNTTKGRCLANLFGISKKILNVWPGG